MTAATTDPNKLAATLEAETLERAGQITFSQARQRIRDGHASPVAHLAPRKVEVVVCPPKNVYRYALRANVQLTGQGGQDDDR